MDTEFVEEIVSIHSDSQTLDFGRENTVLYSNNIGDPKMKTEYFDEDDIDSMSSNNCLVQTIESSYLTNSDERKNELNNMTRAVMESVPYADGLQYLAAISSFSDNFKVSLLYVKVYINMLYYKCTIFYMFRILVKYCRPKRKWILVIYLNLVMKKSNK